MDEFREISAEIVERHIQACHRVKNNQIIVKFSNKKDFLHILLTH